MAIPFSQSKGLRRQWCVGRAAAVRSSLVPEKHPQGSPILDP
jgi:hypothetical protein